MYCSCSRTLRNSCAHGQSLLLCFSPAVHVLLVVLDSATFHSCAKSALLSMCTTFVPVACYCVPRCVQVSLVVLDSATFHFRQDFTDAAQRSRLMLSMAQQLAEVAEQRGVAVVMVNQVGLERGVVYVSLVRLGLRQLGFPDHHVCGQLVGVPPALFLGEPC